MLLYSISVARRKAVQGTVCIKYKYFTLSPVGSELSQN